MPHPFPIHYREAEPCTLGDDLPLRLLHLGGVTIESTWNLPDLSAPFWRFYSNLDRGAAIIHRSQRTEVLPGRLYVVPAWMAWASECTGQVRHASMHLDIPAFSREATATVIDRPLCIADHDLAAELADLAHRLGTVAVPTPTLQCAGYLLAYRCLEALLAALDEDDAGRLWRPERHNPLAPLIDHIGRNLDGGLDNARLAQLAGCSQAQLDRLFRRFLQTTPARYVRQRRIARAAELLTTTDDDLPRIAERCGFPNRHHLTRLFRAALGSGPAEYRRRR